MTNILENHFIKRVMSLGLPANDFAIIGSGTMFVLGIKELSDDIDLIARGGVWEKVVTLGKVEVPASGSGKVVRLFDGEIEVFDSWAPGEWDVNELIDNAFVLEGLRFVNLETILKWMRLRDVPKAKIYVKLIEDYLAKESK